MYIYRVLKTHILKKKVEFFKKLLFIIVINKFGSHQKPETTENDVVPMPGLVWRCEFTYLKVKEEDLVFTTAVARLANISATKKKDV